ncbi:MAG: DUF2127 domain-containing protein [Gemmatimonadaceae bacterium]
MSPDIHAPAVPAATHASEHWRERDQIIEVIAIFKFIKAAGLIAIDFGVIKLLQPATADRIQAWILALSDSAQHPLVQRLLVQVLSYSPRRIQAVGVVALVFATLYIIEGIGLWHQSRWAEYLTITATSLFIPLEVYELIERVTVPRAGALIINLVAVAYLVYRLRHPTERIKLF